MTTIKILPEILSNQIAAGEVVQRPASAVKELVENAIDAGAQNITIDIVKGGKSLIRVSDDGMGMSRDDAILATERYATSKIFTRQDLFSISTMGFRGEALPSIASISQFTLITRTRIKNAATQIEILGGTLKNVSDAGAPVGTTIIVKNLFFNTPARKKFLKSDQTETSHIIDTISGMALGNPDIGFSLTVNNRLYKTFSVRDTLRTRCANVLGKDTYNELYRFERETSGMTVKGFCANPRVTRSTSSRIFLFVNHRLVYDRGLISAVFKGYRQRIMKGRYPLAVVFIDIGYDQVDVNVHPSKREIKFFNPGQVYEIVSAAISTALAREQQDVKTYSQKVSIPKERFEFRDPADHDGTVSGRNSADSPGSSLFEVPVPVPEPPVVPEESSGKIEQSVADWSQQTRMDSSAEMDISVDDSVHHPQDKISHPHDKIKETMEHRSADGSVSPAVPHVKISSLKIIGQVMGTYIIVESEDALMLIDQHAAHERIVFEKLKKRHQSLKVQSQSLAVPEIVELNFREADYFNTILDDLNALGFQVAPFGDNSFVVKSVPSIIDEKQVQPILMNIVDRGVHQKDQPAADEWLDQCLILMACHSTIRANAKLTSLEIQQLLVDLETCKNTRHCPHGRPIIITLTQKQIERLFKRVV